MSSRAFPLGDAVGSRFFFTKSKPADGRYVYDPGDTRYVPQSLNGGTGWGTFDRQRGRFLDDREVRLLTEDELMMARIVQ